ncbi:MAG: hypothetical protein COT00_03985 [Candidatus Omnitrophica bacterium CG07_land_8_20_14_0_80_50_8]|nr:MAG: hypothetical protein COT00_03985 [Candidatus Omnitrophica bacterium CG07_land_8_20_14_0_80_50_8]
MLTKFFVFLRLSAGFVFAASGFIKLMQPTQNFLSAIQSYELLGGTPAVLLAKTMPWAEFIVGVFLIVGLWSRISILILWLFNTVFIGVVSYALIRRLPIQDCGCFGDSFSLPPQKILCLDIALWFVFLSLAAFFDRSKHYGLDKYFED